MELNFVNRDKAIDEASGTQHGSVGVAIAVTVLLQRNKVQ